MRVLGLGGSCRSWGNTEILVRTALHGAAQEGAETRFLNLAELRLEPCTGCMACVFQDRDCVLEDRYPELLAGFRWADGVVLGSPAYVLGATGAVKNLHDRMIRCGASREFAGKPGLALVAAGVPGWEPFSLAQVAMLFLFLGMPVVDQFVGYAQGPGEILDDAPLCERARAAGAALARGDTGYRGAPGSCPVCRLDLVTPTGDGNARCLLCDLEGRWADGLVPAAGALPRWAEARMREHFVDKVLASGPRFRARRKELRARVRGLRAALEDA